MQNVIHRVMKAEQEAQRILQEARTEAERLLDETRRQAKAKEEQARIDVRREADTLIEKTVQVAEKEKAAQLAAAVLEIESGVRIDEPVRHRAVTAAVECITGKYQTG